MQSDATRAAFTLSLIHQRRDDRRITSLAVLQSGSRVFLGLDNGVLEEHTCLAATAAGALHPTVAAAAGGMLVLRLLAEKKVFSKQGVADIRPADAAARLVCLSEEGQVALVSLETFAVAPLPAARGAVAVAVQPTQHLPVLLAVAVKHGKGRSKVLLFSILPGANVTGSHQPAVLLAQVQVPEAVLGLAWAGRSLLLAVPGGYQALHPVQQPLHSQAAAGHSQQVTWQVAVLADHLADISPMLGCIPDLGLGLMLWEENMVLITDATGAAVREPLQLPMPPLALAAAGLFVVVLCDDGLHVFDRASSREVQHIDYAHDDAHVRLRGRLPAASDSSCRCICLASSSQVLRLEPIALEQQVRELLKRKRFGQALDLIQSTPTPAQQHPATPAGLQQQPSLDEHTASTAAVAAAPAGPSPWQQVALAQAGLLLLLECEFEAGLAVLEGLPAEVWQPCQLFSLFPGSTARWVSKVPVRSYWGLHGSQLPDLQQLVTDMLELKAATAPSVQRQQQQQQQAAAASDFFIGTEQQEVPWLTPAHVSHSPSMRSSSSSSVHHHHHHHHHNAHVHGSSNSLSSSTYGINPAELQGLVQQGKAAIAGYLSKARTRPGVILLDGIDTLLLQLLCDVEDAAAVEALVAGKHAAAVGAAAATLRSAARWHALAMLLMNAGQPQEALNTWQALASGDLQEAPSGTGAVTAEGGDAAAVAVAAAAAAMAAGAAVVPLQLLLEPSREAGSSSRGSLRWLLSVDAAACLAVLESRCDLDPQQVLQLLEEAGDIDLCWQYLYHQVHHSSSNSSQLHTQLATVLLAALSALIDTNNDTSSSSSSEPAALAQVAASQLVDMVHQLPLSFTPNTAAAAAAAGEAQGLWRSYSQGLGHPPRQSGFGSSSSYYRQQQSSSQLPSPHHSRFPSLMGARIPTAISFAISAADVARRGSRELQSTQPPGAATLGAQASSQGHTGRQQEQQQQQQRSCQPFNYQLQGQLSVLAGQPVNKTPSLLAHQAGVLTQQHNLSGFGAAFDATAGGAPGPRKTLSNIAQMMRLHGGAQASVTGISSRDANGRQPIHQQQQLQQQLSLEGVQPQQQALRVLPLGLGPWPVEPSGGIVDGAGQADASSDVTAGAVVAADDGRQVRPAAVAAAAAAAFDRVLLLRCLLVYHLQASLLYDVKAVLSAVGLLPLHPEQALLHSRAGRHSTALALLALCPPRLVEGAISYCRALGSQEAWLALLELFLNPAGFAAGVQGLDEGLSQQGLQGLTVAEPDYASACRVLNAEGASLNPLCLLAALPSDMPLHLAGGLLGQVINGLQHRRRHGQVVRALHRCRRLAAHAELVELQAGRVLLTDDTPCNGCGRLIGAKVFYRYPSGVVVCGRCSGAVAVASGAEASALAGVSDLATGAISMSPSLPPMAGPSFRAGAAGGF